jgi:hypothetical protein
MRPGTGDQPNALYARYVRGNAGYGRNKLEDNGDGTVTDNATGLTWEKGDSGKGMDWKAALAWAEKRNADKYLGHADWRLPNAKELQSIADYSRVPAIDPVFACTAIKGEGGEKDYPFYWASTTHLDNMGGVYVAFGRALGWMEMPRGSGQYKLLDVHGAGAQRSDPKSGSAAAYPRGKGPQGDVIRIDNFVRLVRGGAVKPAVCVKGEAAQRGEDNAEPAAKSPRRRAPQEAIAACYGRSEGEEVTFTTLRGPVTATCRLLYNILTAIPARPR